MDEGPATDEGPAAYESPAADPVAGSIAPPAWERASFAALTSALSEGTTAPLARVTRVGVPARGPEYGIDEGPATDEGPAAEESPAAYESPAADPVAGSIAPPAWEWASFAALTSALSEGTTAPLARVTRVGVP